MKKTVQFIFGIFLMALAFNIFITEVNTVNGMTGIGLIFNKKFALNASLVILIGNIFCLLLSVIFLGIDITKNSIIGSILYPIFITLTEPLSELINIGNTEPILITLCGALLLGTGIGLVFKAGFTTGGVDILNQIVSKYLKIPIGKCVLITDGIVTFIGLLVFGFETFIYTLIFIYIISVVIDKIMLGISDSKTFFIFTDYEEEIRKMILEKFSIGATIVNARGGYTDKPKKMTLCVINTRIYMRLKEEIFKIDKEAYILITDAYEVAGGSKKYKEEK